MTAWQPIETAPKDGTLVTFYVPGQSPCWGRADDLQAGPYWLDGATHWLPLPPPPQGNSMNKPTPPKLQRNWIFWFANYIVYFFAGVLTDTHWSVTFIYILGLIVSGWAFYKADQAIEAHEAQQ